MHALVSIHDVMPTTLVQVRQIIDLIPVAARTHVVLLIVPGLDWGERELDQLRRWQHDGFALAGHGWRHEVTTIRSLYHRCHSALISRRAAEHLAYDRDGLLALVKRNHHWFTSHGLAAPEIYVPPAWAMGPLSTTDLQKLPFRYYETATGIYHADTDTYRRLPLAGFEADTYMRALLLTLWNHANRAWTSPARPLRLSLHPFDLKYRLGSSLRKFLREICRWRDVASIFNGFDGQCQ